MSRTALVKAGALVLILLAVIALALILGTPDIAAMRSRIDEAGVWGPALFFTLYVGLALIPCPKALLTAAGGALFGLWAGAGLALTGALVGAIISFGVGRLLGREAVDRLISGRLARVDSLLSDHGLSAVLIVRLVPLVPFIAINYASGLSGVKFRHFALGSALGMVPGSLAYAALGAYGTNPWGLAAAVSALIVLVVGGSWWARRLDAPRDDESIADPPHV
ncbi:MAG: TVP38/TMEM64 family protein [Nocardioides sp.]|nr:TVP38/TMEM64 family protein [Nocardioides sp.]